MEKSVWASGQAYEPYVGRWSRRAAREFVRWLAVPPAARWLDVGCGTGALTETILRCASPSLRRAILASRASRFEIPEFASTSAMLATF